jgi:16S rRNA (uracil1498-N3)-methyltransferase
MHLFYSKLIDGKLILLDEVESKHCLKVMRLGINEIIHITDGAGSLYESRIIDTSSGKVSAEIVNITKPQAKKPYRLHIAIAPTKNSERFEWFVEKAAEIGVDEITPLVCQRSERTKINTERLRKILISAVKQSLKTILPSLNEPVSFPEFIKKNVEGQRFIASCLHGDEKEIQSVYTKGSGVLVLIGPEGDFTAEEVSSAVKTGFYPVSLGKSRLRTETAGMYVSAVISILNSDPETAK